MTDGQPENFSYVKRLGRALAIAVLVTLPFVLTHEEPVTGEIAFAPADVAAGDVRQVKCPFRMPRQHNAACYRAYVRQDHDRPDSPLISILAVIWLWNDTGDTVRVANHLEATFFYVLPSLPMFLVMPMLLRGGMAFWAALGASVLMTVALYGLVVFVASRFGIQL